MKLFSRMDRSADLVNGMAERLGFGLSDRIAAAPDVEGPRFAAMVRRCSACSDQPGCTALQSTNPRLDLAPDYCLNREILARR
ncbi:hypothetical protein SAMN05444007_10393 [Cribrihabitans marinus]|uniref:DUF6455 domain-containing protein n=1 Tax=Cribrihabitans marinus TaxID=1227549 RepID=A0A1H6V4J6_9RHOB|nr:DUF6455 family protein [Cribrihabitans marinus]SEI99569.1 hypothetical protein SAMN05444007_10393 [Cribrihabitans marinus]